MTRSSEIKSINCTSCGAGLDIFGGGRVQVHACGYCGSVLDAQENYQVIKKYTDLIRPASPFSIGISGVIQGVEFTIIGTLGYEERWGGKFWSWTEHQLFSPTHGYAYLTVERRHLTFTRKYRKSTRPGWISSQTVEIAEHRPVVFSDDDRYQYYDTSTSKLTFVEGEFNWRPEIGRTATTVNMMSEDAMLSFSETATEREVHRTVYLPLQETIASFGLKDVQPPAEIHRLMPYKKGLNEVFLKSASLIFAGITLLLIVVLLAQTKGTQVAREHFAAGDLPAEFTFEITRSGRLARIDLSADVDNSWAYFDLALTDPDDTPVFEAGRTVELYSGRDADGAWREGSNETSITFMPETAGVYTLEVNSAESGNWGGGRRANGFPFGYVTLRISEGIATLRWMLALTVVFTGIGFYHIVRPLLHSRRRWWGSDWTEED